jgi:hypothetical protein
VAARVLTDETTSSTSYVALTTPGPSVTVTVPASGRVLIALTAGVFTSTGGGLGFMSFTCSVVAGDCTSTGSDITALNLLGNDRQKATATFVLTGLTPGPTTFTAVYRSGGPGSASFQNRSMWVAPL